MTDKVQLIKQEIERLHELLPVMDGDNVSINYAETICTALEEYIDSLPKEPASEDLENAAKSYGFFCYKRACFHPEHKWPSTTEDAFKAGANWCEQQMMKHAEDAHVFSILYGKDETEVQEGYIERDLGGQLVIGRSNAPSGDEFMLMPSTMFSDVKCGEKYQAKILIIKQDKQ